MAEINLGGRPALYTNPEDFKVCIEAYFEEYGSACTITGLAYYLGFESRQSFYDYTEREAFSYIGKRAKLFVEMCYESKLCGNNPTGPIFFLKNMGWKDKTETGFTDSDGKDINPVAIFQIPDNGRNKDNTTAGWLPDAGTQQPG